MPEIELIQKVQKENNEKFITALILTIHIQWNSSYSLPDLDNVLHTCLFASALQTEDRFIFPFKVTQRTSVFSVEKL